MHEHNNAVRLLPDCRHSRHRRCSRRSPLQGKRDDDVVVMNNGDKFTGEIKKLENGILYFKADYMADSAQLDWARVDSLDSKDSFNVSLLGGEHLVGVIVEKDDHSLAVRSSDAEIQGQPHEVVAIVPVEDTFLKQLKGSVRWIQLHEQHERNGVELLRRRLYLSDAWRAQMNGSSVFNLQSGARPQAATT